MSRTYVILGPDDVDDINFSEVFETAENTLRWNNDDSKTFVKFNSSDSTPSFLSGKTQYTHAQILTELAKPEWNPPVPE